MKILLLLILLKPSLRPCVNLDFFPLVPKKTTSCTTQYQLTLVSVASEEPAFTISMLEVISIAASQALSHLCTQLYNVQESYIPYLKTASPTHQNDVFLEPSRSNGRVNYYPRALSVEFSGGYGYLGKYAFQEPAPDLTAFGDVEIDQRPRIEKNEYQQHLDAGQPTDSLMLNVNNTKYWSDYNKLVYKPSSLLTLLEYNHPDGTHKHFNRLKFDLFNIGTEEYKKYGDEIDESFRKLLESLDNIQGVSVFTGLDDAWAGFSNEMLIQLRDEYFNNGVSSKYNIWCYGITSGTFTKQRTLTRIKSLVELSKNSSLFFPLGLDTSLDLLLDDFVASSEWHRQAAHAYFVNSIWCSNNQFEKRSTMAEYEANLLRGADKRNIVNEIAVHEKKLNLATTIIDDPRMIEAVMKGEISTSQKPRSLDLSFNPNPLNAKPFLTQYIIPEDQSLVDELQGRISINRDINKIVDSDSFPKIFESSSLYTQFGQSTGLKDLFKQYRQIIHHARAHKDLELIGDKQELIEDISCVVDEYTQGYDLEEESE